MVPLEKFKIKRKKLYEANDVTLTYYKYFSSFEAIDFIFLNRGYISNF